KNKRWVYESIALSKQDRLFKDAMITAASRDGGDRRAPLLFRRHRLLLCSTFALICFVRMLSKSYHGSMAYLGPPNHRHNPIHTTTAISTHDPVLHRHYIDTATPTPTPTVPAPGPSASTLACGSTTPATSSSSSSSISALALTSASASVDEASVNANDPPPLDRLSSLRQAFHGTEQALYAQLASTNGAALNLHRS
ncbi:hypothetical protein H0H92_005348, partial [Tricholoma furcatifolium]